MIMKYVFNAIWAIFQQWIMFALKIVKAINKVIYNKFYFK